MVHHAAGAICRLLVGHAVQHNHLAVQLHEPQESAVWGTCSLGARAAARHTWAAAGKPVAVGGLHTAAARPSGCRLAVGRFKRERERGGGLSATSSVPLPTLRHRAAQLGQEGALQAAPGAGSSPQRAHQVEGAQAKVAPRQGLPHRRLPR